MSVRMEDRDQLGGQLRRTPEANDSANDQTLGKASKCQAWLANTLSPLLSGLKTQAAGERVGIRSL